MAERNKEPYEKAADERAQQRERAVNNAYAAAWGGDTSILIEAKNTLEQMHDTFTPNEQESLLVTAVLRGSIDVVHYLDEYLNIQVSQLIDERGWTAMHFAAAAGQVDMIKYLLIFVI